MTIGYVPWVHSKRWCLRLTWCLEMWWCVDIWSALCLLLLFRHFPSLSVPRLSYYAGSWAISPVWSDECEELAEVTNNSQNKTRSAPASPYLSPHLTSPRLVKIITLHTVGNQVTFLCLSGGVGRCHLCHLPECSEKKCSIHLYSQFTGYKAYHFRPSKSWT